MFQLISIRKPSTQKVSESLKGLYTGDSLEFVRKGDNENLPLVWLQSGGTETFYIGESKSLDRLTVTYVTAKVQFVTT